MVPPGMEPIRLFRTIAHHPQLLDRFRATGSTLLAHGTLDAREREIVIHRTCARCGAGYEWGVHASLFGPVVGLTEAELLATRDGSPEDWKGRDRLLVRMADELHDTGTVSDELYAALAEGWRTDQLVELIALAGYYHLVSFICNAFGVEPEEWAFDFDFGYRSSAVPS
jgi:alkylhydroperoxidase family enzyme